jgi:hypothetical protein
LRVGKLFSRSLAPELTIRRARCVSRGQLEQGDRNMRRIVLSLAALAAMAIAIPYAGPAQAEETVVVKKRHDHFWNAGPRHEHYWNMEPRRDKTVIIKRGHRDMDRY